jgi:hypothetical protein
VHAIHAQGMSYIRKIVTYMSSAINLCAVAYGKSENLQNGSVCWQPRNFHSSIKHTKIDRGSASWKVIITVVHMYSRQKKGCLVAVGLHLVE